MKFLTKLRSVLEDDGLTRAEFLKAFEAVTNLVLKIKKNNEAEFSELKKDFSTTKQRLEQTTSSDLLAIRKEVKDLCDDVLSQMLKDHTKKMEALDERVASLKDGKDADEEVIVDKVLEKIKFPEQKEVFLDGPQEIRNKLEDLEGEERLDASAIKGLKEEI